MSDEIPDDANIFIGKLDLTVYEEGQTSGPTEVVFGGPVPAVQAFIEHNQDDNTIRIIVGNGPANDGTPPTESIRRFLAFIDQQLANAVDMRIREDPLEALFEAPAHEVPVQPEELLAFNPGMSEQLERQIREDTDEALRKAEREGKFIKPPHHSPITFERLSEMKAVYDRAQAAQATDELLTSLVEEFERNSGGLFDGHALPWMRAAERVREVRRGLREG